MKKHEDKPMRLADIAQKPMRLKDMMQGGSILAQFIAPANPETPIRKALPTLCDACYLQLIETVHNAHGYPYAGIYCEHEQTLAQAEIDPEGKLLGIHLSGPLDRDQAGALIAETFETVAPPGTTPVPAPEGGRPA